MPQYPGLGMPLRHFEQIEQLREKGGLYPMGIHTNCWGSSSDMILVREVAMMIVMERLTDKPDWHIKVFDNAIAGKWIEEGLEIPSKQLYDSIVRGKLYAGQGEEIWYPKRLQTILDRECLEYCITELRAKAEFFNKTGLVPTLDASATVVKSDSFVDESLQQELRAVFAELRNDQLDNPDFHPRTDGRVRNLVHPSLYPLVYGKSRVFQDEVVGVEDAIDKWAGKGRIIRAPQAKKNGETSYGTNVGGSYPHDSLWSNKYQWLPSIVKLQDDGSVRFTSYINNLHPIKYSHVYRTLEKLVERVLPAWDICLTKYTHSYGKKPTPGRSKPRFPLPDKPDDENEDNWDPPFSQIQKLQIPTRNAKAGPTDDEAEVSGEDEDEDEDEDDEESDDHEESDSEGNRYYGTRRQIHWKKIRVPVQPTAPAFQAWDYGVKSGDSLRDQFKDLQIIVKMASIELTPENPSFPVGGWHVEGQMNERIIGTALYYLDSDNITSSCLDFRMQTSSYQDDLQDRVGQDSYSWLEMVYGTHLRSGSVCLQNYGSIETKEGRFLAFPNTFHHRVSPFELKDKTKPGYRRFIALWLVDPLNRIISTANVPPQQQKWWLDRAFSGLSKSDAATVPQSIAQLIVEQADNGIDETVKAAANRKEDLPAELLNMVRNDFVDALPMSHQEALEHRLKLMEERSAIDREANEGWFNVDYNFCEH